MFSTLVPGLYDIFLELFLVYLLAKMLDKI